MQLFLLNAHHNDELVINECVIEQNVSPTSTRKYTEAPAPGAPVVPMPLCMGGG